MSGQNLRDDIKQKFNGISHKWLKIELSDMIMTVLKNALKDALKKEIYSKREIANLLSHFKRNDFAWVKFKSSKGRSTITCNCQLINEKNKVLDITLTGKEVLELELLGGTPKGLKLFKGGKRRHKDDADPNWVKPDDGFDDDICPRIDDELTELGYELYKMTVLEKEGKLEDYIKSFEI